MHQVPARLSLCSCPPGGASCSLAVSCRAGADLLAQMSNSPSPRPRACRSHPTTSMLHRLPGEEILKEKKHGREREKWLQPYSNMLHR